MNSDGLLRMLPEGWYEYPKPKFNPVSEDNSTEDLLNEVKGLIKRVEKLENRVRLQLIISKLEKQE